VVITSDGEELEDEVVEAQTKRDAAGKVFGRMNCAGVETIFVSNPYDRMDRAQYQQYGRTLKKDE
jgi:hypothetical protein